MNIKQKLTWAFAIIACLPVVLVATLVVLNLRSDARDEFVDGSAREIRQVSNAMQLFFDGISQNVDYLAKQPLIRNSDDSLKTYMAANAESVPRARRTKSLRPAPGPGQQPPGLCLCHPRHRGGRLCVVAG